MSVMYRFLPILVILISVLSIAYYTPIKRELSYRLDLDQDPTTSCCNVDEIIKSDGDFNETDNVAIFNNQPIDYPKTSLAQLNRLFSGQTQVLGTMNSAGQEKWIEVSLKEQKLRAWEGDKIFMEFPISSGKWYKTPTGDFAIWYKTRHQRMKGGSKELGTFYDLPNVPSNMFFYQGFAIHGAYWHNNFGNPMSHGCVNSPLSQVKELFEWAGPVVPPDKNVARATKDNPGTRVFVH